MLGLDRPPVDPTTLTPDELVGELQRSIKTLLALGARMPKELMLFVKNMVFLDGAIATLAPDLDLFAEVEAIALLFAAKHGERIMSQLGLTPGGLGTGHGRTQGWFRVGRLEPSASPTATFRRAAPRCARSSRAGGGAAGRCAGGRHRSSHGRSPGRPAPPEVLEPRGQLDGRVGESLGAALFEQALEGDRVVAPAPRIAHHDLEEDGALGAGLERPEGGSLGQLDVGPGGAASVTAEDLARQDHDDVRAEVSVPSLDDPRVPPGVERQVERVGREGEPLLPHRGDGAVGQPHGADLLPGDIEIVEMAEDRFEPGSLRPVDLAHEWPPDPIAARRRPRLTHAVPRHGPTAGAGPRALFPLPRAGMPVDAALGPGRGGPLAQRWRALR